MWTAMKAALESGSATPVAWDAHWEKKKSPVNQKVVEWKLDAMIKKAKRNKPKAPPSMFAKL
jgi:hypothetical protein